MQEEYVKCPQCNGNGWYVGVESGHGCDGTQESCNMNCPIPVQTQEQCEVCMGQGEVLYKDTIPSNLAIVEESNDSLDVPF